MEPEASLQQQLLSPLNTQTSLVQSDFLMFCLVKQKKIRIIRGIGTLYNIEKESADDQFSFSSDSPD